MRPDSQPGTSQGRDRHVIAVLIVPDSVVLEVAMVQQIFGRRISSVAEATGDTATPYDLVLCGEERRQRLVSGVDLGEMEGLEALLSADTVMVPGVEDPLAPRSEALLSHLRSAHASGARMVSFCGGAFLLGRAGILDGRRATTHWLFADGFRGAFPQARLEPERLYIDDGPVHTSGGVFSTVDLSLHLLALDLGRAYANDVSRTLVSAPHRPGGQAQFVKASLRSGREASESALQRWLRENLDAPLTLAQLARREHTSERSLVRSFRRDTGMSVFDWITRERVSRAKELLETTDLKVNEIAVMAGFGSYETLRRNFEADVGITAAAYRRAFRETPAPERERRG